MSESRSYVLGHSEQELQRLKLQADFYLPLTKQLWQEAGIGAGMRVLDFGCGAGDSTFLAAQFVGPSGQVVGVDAAPAALALAQARAEAAGITNVRFVAGNEDSLAELTAEPFDAVLVRLVLMYQPNPAATFQKLANVVRPGGVLAVQELNVANRGQAFPDLPLLTSIWDWMLGACTKAGVEVNMGLKLHRMFVEAGLPAPTVTLNARVEGSADSPVYAFAAETVRTMLPVIQKLGVASADEVGIETLADRLRHEAQAAGAVIVISSLVGAWTRTRAESEKA